MTRIVLGGDPGKTGAVAAVSLEPGNPLLGVIDVPVAGNEISIPLFARAVAELAAGHEVVGTAVEYVNAGQGGKTQGVQTMFRFGRAYGLMLMALGAQWPLSHPTPVKWKAHFHLSGKTEDKDAARLRVIERWPAMADLFARKKDLGRADAALIALWCAETQPIARGVTAA